jgi:chromosome partitioning protein
LGTNARVLARTHAILSAVDTNALDLVAKLRALGPERLSDKIIAVESDKGGIGKTTIAVELAFCLDAVLVDLDWHDGAAARSLGWRHEQRVRSPLLDAMDGGRVPRPIRGGASRPDLVPAGPDLEQRQPPAQVMADALVEWSKVWKRPIVIDTHPGGGEAANGAAQAAHLIPTPCPLAEKELAALEGWCAVMDGFPLMIVPNRVPRVPPASQLDWIASIAERYSLPVATPIPDSPAYLPRRKARTAVCSAKQLSSRSEPLISSFATIAQEVADRA